MPRERIRRWFRWLGGHELGSILGLCVVAGATWTFVAVADEVGEGGAKRFDRALLLAFRSPGHIADPIGPAWVEEAARDVTALGSTTVLGLLTLAVVGYLVLVGRRRAALYVAGSVAGGTALSAGLKVLFDRPRPEVVPHLAQAFSSSFPSGHSMLSTTVYLTLGALVARLDGSLLVKAYVLVWALLLAVLVGVSRVYVGVHWPTDVLAGMAWGTLAGAVGWAASRPLARLARAPGP